MKLVKKEGTKYTMYQTQLDSWDEFNFADCAAMQKAQATARD